MAKDCITIRGCKSRIRREGNRMIVYNERGEIIEDFDLDAGYLEPKSKKVEHRWEVDSEEQGEWVTIKEYPETGGKDVEWKVTSEEQGHWKTVDEEDREVEDFDGDLSDDWPHDMAIPDVFNYAVYHEYTEDELIEREYTTRQSAQLQTFSLMAARAQVATLEFESETEIAAVSTLLPDWVPDGHEYKQGNAFQWEKRTWRVSQDTTSQSIYPPDVSEALYYEIVIAPDGIIVYRAAHGKYDSVRKGELRHYPDADSPVYRSKVDWNAYAPDVVPDNWELVE